MNSEIDARKRAKDMLRESRARLLRLIEVSPYIIFALSPKDGRITSLNSAFEKITGWSRAEWIDRSFKDLIHPDDAPTATRRLREALHGEVSVPFELEFLSMSGECVLVEIIAAANVRDGNVVEIFGFARDITGRKHVEEALRESEERFRALFEFAPDGYHLTDLEGRAGPEREGEGIGDQDQHARVGGCCPEGPTWEKRRRQERAGGDGSEQREGAGRALSGEAEKGRIGWMTHGLRKYH